MDDLTFWGPWKPEAFDPNQVHRDSLDDYVDLVSLLDPVEAEVPYEEVTVRV